MEWVDGSLMNRRFRWTESHPTTDQCGQKAKRQPVFAAVSPSRKSLHFLKDGHQKPGRFASLRMPMTRHHLPPTRMQAGMTAESPPGWYEACRDRQTTKQISFACNCHTLAAEDSVSSTLLH